MRSHLRACCPELDERELDERIQEFLKFICLQSMHDSGFIPVSDEIDLIWHEYILQTRAYEQLCKDLPGRRFVHHQTISLTEYAQIKSREEVLREMLNWIPAYRMYFGNFTEKTARYWLIVSFLMQELGLKIQDINALASK